MVATADITIESLQIQLQQRDQQIIYLEEQLAWLKRQIFGKKSERIVDTPSEQLMLEGFENLSEQKEEKQTVAAHKRRKRTPTGEDTIQLPGDLPVETTVIDLPEEEKICKETGVALKPIGEEVSFKLAHHPGSYFLKKFVRPKYAHPKQEEKGVLISPMPESLLPKCRADESLLAEIITRKFVDHLPLYRIAEIKS